MKMRNAASSKQRFVPWTIDQVNFSSPWDVVSVLGEGAMNISRHLMIWDTVVMCSIQWMEVNKMGAPLSFCLVLGRE